MPRYNYICEDCEDKVIAEFGEDNITTEQFEELVLFETSHAMEPTKKELKEAKTCPRCGGTNCRITVFGTDICSYIKGYGWRDRDGARRDMHRYHLTNSDPYAKYRVPGEVDDMKKKLEKAGKGGDKKQHFVQNSKAVNQAVEHVVNPPKQC